MRIHTIETGFFSTDGGAMFGILPKRIWSRKYPSDSDNRCPMTMRVAYVELGAHKVLFDAGVGAANVPEMNYYRFEGLKSLAGELAALGCAPEALTDVVLSHLHFDHCGGLLQMDAAGERSLVFPNATYWVSRAQWENALNPSGWESDSYDPGLLKALADSGKLMLLDADGLIFPGVYVELYQGHTDGQLVSWIGTKPDSLCVFAGDVVPMELHVMALCIAAVDNSARVSADEKLRLLNAVCEKHAQLVFYHDPNVSRARLKTANGRISVCEKITC